MSTISPDAVAPVDLTIFDRDAEALRTLALTDAATRLPEWTPREGNLEVTLLDSFALVISELIWTINRLPSAVRNNILALLDIVPDPGAPATTTIQFNLSDADGHTVPAGTRVRLDVQGAAIVFALDADTVALPTETTATGAATATTFGADPNGILAGTTVAPIDQVFFVDSAEIASTIQDGRDPEDDAAYTARAVQRLARLSDVLVLGPQFTAAALEFPAVHRALTIDSYDGTGGPPYTDGGHVTLVLYGQAGNLSIDDKAEVLADLQARVVAGVLIHILDPTITTVDVTATVHILDGFVEADVLADVDTALRAYLSPGEWDWAATVRRNELISLIDQVAGVDYVATLTVPPADVTLSGDGPLAGAGTIGVTAA